jgi:hypothetical protein
MIRQTRQTDLKLFADLAKAPQFAKPADVPFSILLPAFVTSELKTGVPDRLPDLPALPDHRPGRRIDADGARHDDAVALDRLDAVQAVAVRAGGRMGADYGIARE